MQFNTNTSFQFDLYANLCYNINEGSYWNKPSEYFGGQVLRIFIYNYKKYKEEKKRIGKRILRQKEREKEPKLLHQLHLNRKQLLLHRMTTVWMVLEFFSVAETMVGQPLTKVIKRLSLPTHESVRKKSALWA